MKKSVIGILSAAVVAAALFTGCGAKSTTLTVGATALPHAEILNLIKDDMANEGVTLEVKEFGDYTLLNQALHDKQIDANFFQHTPFLENYNQISGHSLTEVVKVHIEPMGLYSNKAASAEELADGATIAIPNDATNEARSLLLLESLGYIKLRDGAGFGATPADIIENPKSFQFKELDAAILPRTLDETDAAVINTNYALEAGLNPINDALVMEPKDSPYANILVVNAGDENNEAVQKLVKVLTSDKVRQFIETTYDGAVVPAF